MGSHHADERKQVLHRLLIATALCSFFLIVEVVGGLLAGSLAVLSDAAHLFADLASFAVAIAATFLASMPATKAHTYGLKRSESLGALFSMTSLAFVTVTLAYEAVRRLITPEEAPVDGKLMVVIASIGVVVNIALAFVLGENHVHLPGSSHGHAHEHGPCGHDDEEHGGHDHSSKHHEEESHDHHDHSHKHQEHDHSHGHEHQEECHEHHGHDHDDHHKDSHDHHETETSSLIPKKDEGGCHGHGHGHHESKKKPTRNVNLQAAYLHVLGDLALSVAVLIAGLIIWFKPEWQKLDPIITIVFSAMVFYSTLGVLRTSIAVLLEEIPSSISWQKVFEDISNIPCINNVHDLHIWSIHHGEAALTVHCSSDDANALTEVYKVCKAHDISHATIQIQPNEEGCATCTISCMSHFESSTSC
ncbi:unnamed protein product [Cylindrotheca closterium]|uniref:Cation efflux protein transmembrane domain-containing protein n=1 Tax=Cylindrotheca closterium TaxID=2856 RepID=A0AAD2CLG9_9STRA|nr:unnamed protein product [Cylindrotheca closterium]